MTSRAIATTSAVLLFVAGAALLFGADVLLPTLDQAGVAWVGQLLGAAWLGVATLNWLTRRGTLGGIYGRPIVLTNAALYFISAMVLIEPARERGGPLLWTALGAAAIMTAAYGRLLFGGPLESKDQSARRT